MLARTYRRVSSAANLLRPSTIFRVLQRLDQVSGTASRALADANALRATTREMQAAIAALQLKTEQLMTIERLDWEHRQRLEQLSKQLDPVRIGAHVARAVDDAPLHGRPFPHIVVQRWLPDDVYDAMVRAVPPPIFFADRDVSRQRLTVPFEIAPAYSQRVWRFLCEHVTAGSLQDALNEKFRALVLDYVRSMCDGLPPDIDLTLRASDGRIMLRRPGYVIAPHRDPKWGFMTALAYLACAGDNETYGTQLYHVRDDEEAPTDKPYYVNSVRCELVKAVPFVPNTMLVFLNSAGAHGASIPADAQPATLERYVYQFRLGPGLETIRELLSHMPEQRRAAWTGAKEGRALAFS